MAIERDSFGKEEKKEGLKALDTAFFGGANLLWDKSQPHHTTEGIVAEGQTPDVLIDGIRYYIEGKVLKRTPSKQAPDAINHKPGSTFSVMEKSQPGTEQPERDKTRHTFTYYDTTAATPRVSLSTELPTSATVGVTNTHLEAAGLVTKIVKETRLHTRAA